MKYDFWNVLNIRLFILMLYGLVGLEFRRCDWETILFETMENFRRKKLVLIAFKNLLQIYISDHNCLQISLNS